MKLEKEYLEVLYLYKNFLVQLNLDKLVLT